MSYNNSKFINEHSDVTLPTEHNSGGSVEASWYDFVLYTSARTPVKVTPYGTGLKQR